MLRGYAKPDNVCHAENQTLVHDWPNVTKMIKVHWKVLVQVIFYWLLSLLLLLLLFFL